MAITPYSRRSGLLAVTLVFVLGASPTMARVGIIVALEGNASITDSNSVQRVAAVQGSIQLNDRITTGTGAKLQLELLDGTLLSIGESSEMLIDEYTLSPQDPSESRGSLRLVKGLFRLVTGKITKLNPDKYRVRTRVATIGIRGCDTGYDVTDDDVNVMAFHFGPGESMLVRMIDQDEREQRGGWDGIVDGDWSPTPTLWRESRSMTQAGQTITITPRQGMRDGQISPQQMRRFTASTTPGSGEGDAIPGTEGATEGDEMELDGDEGGTGGVAGDALPGGDMPENGLIQRVYIPAETLIDPFPSGLEELHEEEGIILPGGLDLTEGEFVPLDPIEEPAGASDDGGSDESVESPLPLPEPPTGGDAPLTPVFVPYGGGSHWSWGVWEQGGQIQSVAFSGTHLGPADVQSLVNGATLYNLSGSGDSGAMVQQGGQSSFLAGTVDVSLQIGGSVAPTWDGIFALGNGAGDSLDFTAAGSVQQDGSFQGNTLTYQLRVGGNSFDRNSITAEDIHGNLVGTAANNPPVSGVVGAYHFDHGGAATVNGGFGADVQ